MVSRAQSRARPIAGQLVDPLVPGEADQLLDLLNRFTYPPADHA